MHLSGRIRDKTILRARQLEVAIERPDSRTTMVFGNCELEVGEAPDKAAALAAAATATAPRPPASEPAAEPASAAPAASATTPPPAADAPQETLVERSGPNGRNARREPERVSGTP